MSFPEYQFDPDLYKTIVGFVLDTHKSVDDIGSVNKPKLKLSSFQNCGEVSSFMKSTQEYAKVMDPAYYVKYEQLFKFIHDLALHKCLDSKT